MFAVFLHGKKISCDSLETNVGNIKLWDVIQLSHQYSLFSSFQEFQPKRNERYISCYIYWPL